MQCGISFRNTVIRHLYTLRGGHNDVYTLFGTILVIAILLTMTFQLLIGITEMNSLIDESACFTTITMESLGNVVVESESLPSLWSLVCLPLSFWGSWWTWEIPNVPLYPSAGKPRLSGCPGNSSPECLTEHSVACQPDYRHSSCPANVYFNFFIRS